MYIDVLKKDATIVCTLLLFTHCNGPDALLTK